MATNGGVHTNGSFTLMETDLGTDSDLDSRPDCYIVLTELFTM